MGEDFKVSIHADNPRAEIFQNVFGRLTVNVKSPFQTLVEVPDFDEPQAAYLLDFDFVSEEEYEKLVDFISEKFEVGRDDVWQALKVAGLPILTTDCVLTIENPVKWLDFSDAPIEHWDEDDDYDEDWWGED